MKNSSKSSYGQLLHSRKSWYAQQLSLIALATVCSMVGWQQYANAQSNFYSFDSGTDAPLVRGNPVVVPQAGLDGTTTYSFPAVGTGKGYRIQCTSASVPNPAGLSQAQAVGRSYNYDTNVYTDFYAAVDLVDWNPDVDQVPGILARITGQTGGPLGNGLGAVDGYALIHEILSDGDAPTDRLGGDFTMYSLFGEAPVGIAAAELSLQRGRSYRIIFKGVGTILTGQVYDFEDLTAPIVTIVADDSSHSSGVSGILSFTSSYASPTDATFDNFLVAPATSDPNGDIAPAIRHPIAGTPQVVTRSPAARHSNFYPPASGISINARTFTTAQINASATKLYLNGVDRSASLAPFPANGNNVNFSTAAGTLSANQVYAALIVLEDTTGNLKSTNTFWFDTFSDASLASLKTIEAEDYNYSNGVYQLDPIPVSGIDTNGSKVNGSGVGYFDDIFASWTTGTEGIDYHDNRTTPDSPNWVDFRYDNPSTIHGCKDDIADLFHPIGDASAYPNDTQRQKYAALGVKEYLLGGRFDVGEWMNYTRVFADTNYYVYLRCSSFGPANVALERVTSDPKLSGQTTSPLGTFNIPNRIRRTNFAYEPLRDASGSPLVVHLSGTETLRMTLLGTAPKQNRLLYLNYLLLVPTSETIRPPTVLDTFGDLNDTANPAWDRYDPLGVPPLSFPPTSFLFTNGGYRIYTPAPPTGDYGQARAGSFLRNSDYSDFYVSVDVIDFDDTIRQVFGIAARVSTPGLGTTDGYLFSWEPGGGVLPGTDNGDLDVSPLDGELPLGQIEEQPSGVHLERGKSYRFVFMGKGFDFVGEIYEHPDLANPIKRVLANDPNQLYASGKVGLVVSSQGSVVIPADATFDTFLVTTAEPRLTANVSGGSVIISWPQISFRLQTSSSMGAQNWTTVTSGIVQVGDQNTYTVPATSQQYFRLVYP